MRASSYNGQRNTLVCVKLSELEDNLLAVKSECCGMNKSEYIRELICGSLPSEAPPKEFYMACNDLNKIGINLNQIAKNGNIYGVIERDDIEKVLDYSEKVIDILMDIKRIVLKSQVYAPMVYDEYAYARREAARQGKAIPKFGDDIEEYREMINLKMYKDRPEVIYKKRTDDIDITMSESE